MKLVLSIIASLVATTAMAGEFFVLDMDDVQLKSNQGQDTIRLKRELRSEYQGLNLRKAELLSVVMVAKTAAGKGTAQLSVGDTVTARQTVAGNRKKFQASTEKSYDRVLFKGPAQKTRGPWQLQLRGNFKVRQIVAEIDMNPSQKLVLDFGHMHVKTGQGDQDTLALKRAAKQQQGLQMNDFEIISATILAKSRRGNGKVQLKVGDQLSEPQTIAGSPAEFKGQVLSDYHQIKIQNPAGSSNGRWQMKLKGNIKVHQVVLEIKQK